MKDVSQVVLDPKKVRAARRKAGYSQVGVAAAVGVGRSAICKIEKGIALPSATTLVRFCLLVDAAIPDLVARAPRAG